MALEVGTGKARAANELAEALQRGREDIQFFTQFFLKRTLHDGQEEFLKNAEATINALASANRYGKTTLLTSAHAHGGIYKTGGEPRYLDPITGQIDQNKFRRLRYETIHTSKDSEEAYAPWDEMLRLKEESAVLDAFIKNAPLSKPPHIDWITGARWKFRTLGHDASGIDGRSFYIISIDEAGWIDDLEEKMGNVIRVRVADVRGRIIIVGTFKPGISRDFYKVCVRASAYTGAAITFAHGGSDEAEEGTELSEDLDASIKKYLREFFRREIEHDRPLTDDLWNELAKLGITPDEFADVVKP